MKMLRFEGDDGESVVEAEVPPDLKDEAELYRAQAAEAAAEFDDELMAKFLDEKPLSVEEIKRGLRKGTLAGAIQPTFAGASRHHRGVQPMMDGIVDYLASPLDRPVIEGVDADNKPAKRDARKDTHFSALAFKTTTDRHGELTFLRIYTGNLRSGDTLWNPRFAKPERPLNLVRMFANHKKEPISAAGPGEIVAVVGLKGTVTGDTLCDRRFPIILERPRFAEPVLQVAIEPKSSGDKDRLDEVLKSLAKDDPTFRVSVDAGTGQTMLQCMGELHSEVILFRITNDFNVQATLREPRVAYKEIPQADAAGESTYQAKVGDKNVFGHVRVRVTPSKRQVAPRVSEDGLDGETRKALAKFMPAIRDGLVSEAERGPVAGFPLIYTEVTVTGGTVTTESTEAAYSQAAANALREALSRTKATIVEPHMKFEVTAPESSIGDIINDLNRRGADITDMRALEGGKKVVTGNVPLSKMFGYATTMRSITGGLGAYSLEPFEYRPVSEHELKERFGDFL
jgi:elongation factor G